MCGRGAYVTTGQKNKEFLYYVITLQPITFASDTIYSFVKCHITIFISGN